MGKQSVDVRSSSSLSKQRRWIAQLAPPFEDGRRGGQFGRRDVREHAQNVQVREMLVVFAGRSGTVQHYRSQTFALGLLQTIHEFQKFIFHLLPATLTNSPTLRLRPNPRRQNRRSLRLPHRRRQNLRRPSPLRLVRRVLIGYRESGR